MSGWQQRLGLTVALHDFAVSGYRLVGGEAALDRIEAARLGVVEVIDGAMAAGVPEPEVDAELARLRAEQHDAPNLPENARSRATTRLRRSTPMRSQGGAEG